MKVSTKYKALSFSETKDFWKDNLKQGLAEFERNLE